MKKQMVLHTILILLEIAALMHDIPAFGAGMIRFYTIDSNILQLVISALILLCLVRKRPISKGLVTVHLISAVALTVTFLIAALVLAPQEGFAYYFLSDVAPINHFLGPLLSVVSFLTIGEAERLSAGALFAPAGATLLYGMIALALNGLGILDGPYFFLRVRSESAAVVIQWFAIIAVLCVILSGIYLWGRKMLRSGKRK